MIDLALLRSPQDWPLFGQVAALFAFLALALMCYLHLHTRWLYRHLRDIRSDRQVAFLLQEWRSRNLRTVLLLMLLGMGATLAARHWVPMTEPVPAPAPQRAEVAPVTAPVNPADSVLQLFDPMQQPEETESLEALKQRYEKALVAAYILQRCKRAAKAELDALREALSHELQALRAEGNGFDAGATYNAIIEAARGSYDLFYHRTACDAPALDIVEQQLAAFALKFQMINQSPARPSPAETPNP